MDARSRLDALTGLRFAAALAVAAPHLPPLQNELSLGATPRRMVAEGFASVPFFFILSGFVLAQAYHSRLASPTWAMLGDYYLSRFARIWPIHLLALGFVVLFPLKNSSEGLGPLLANALLIHAWIPDLSYIQSFNSVSWTLSIEVFFYLTLPPLIALSARSGAGPRSFIALAVLAWVVPAGLVLWHCSALGEWSLYVCNVCPVIRMGEFVTGMCLGMAFVHARVVARPPTSRERVIWSGWEWAGIVAVGVFIFHSDRVPLLFRLNGYYTPVFAFVIAVFAWQRGAVSWLARRRASVYLGEMSFAFFMVHGIVFVYLDEPLRMLGIASLGCAAIMVLAAGLAAGVIHKWFEMPIRDWLIGLGSGRRMGEMVAEPTVIFSARIRTRGNSSTIRANAYRVRST